MAVSKIVEVDETGKKFWLDECKSKLLTSSNPVMSYAVGLPMLASVYENIKACFKQDGPSGTVELPNLHIAHTAHI